MNLIFLLLSLLGLYALIVIPVYLFRKKIIFRATSLPESYTFQFNERFEEVYVPVKEGKLHALYFSSPEHKKVVLYFHGNRGHLQRWGHYAEEMANYGCDFFAMDYRTYGKSRGNLSISGLHDDAEESYKWLRTRYKPEEIVIYGRSLGSGVASQLAAEFPSKLLVLETPYDHLEDVIKARFPFSVIPLPFGFPLNNEKNIQKVKYPILIFHGTKDRVIPYKYAIRLAEWLKPGDHFITLPGGGHRDVNRFEEYREHMRKALG